MEREITHYIIEAGKRALLLIRPTGLEDGYARGLLQERQRILHRPARLAGILPANDNMLHAERAYSLWHNQRRTAHFQNGPAKVKRVVYARPPFRLTNQNEIGTACLARDRLGWKLQS